MPTLQLKDFQFSEFFQSEGLMRLDQTFLVALENHHPELKKNLLSYRHDPKQFSELEISELLIHCARFLEEFLADLFNISEALAISKIKTTELNPLSIFKKYFVLRRAKKELRLIDTFPSFEELNQWLTQQLATQPLQTDDKEMAVALLGTHYLNTPETYAEEIELLVQWCARALVTPAANIIYWTSFKIPERIDFANLVPTQAAQKHAYSILSAPETKWRLRDGFKLTDPRMNVRQVQDEVNYCIYCHDHLGDFCAKGFPVKKGLPELGFKKNPLDVILTGCPLEEKISEMNFLKKDGHTLASLAMVMVDNPMCPATGHRICNDCMKACIYQKQDPVNIPQIETRVLTDVLALPWGVEIYDLLTRWNPLRQSQFVMKPYNGLKIMIAGMGPAGFTLAHHLLLEGFAVVGFDGLKIEKLAEELINQPIYAFKELTEALDERIMAGFGGVAEYGITVRWDKNFLKLIYLSLMRRPYFQVFGSVRFGGTVTMDDAWALGFDHFVVAVGAGLPKALSIPGSMAPGMRQANDFLMALQLGNAAKASSLSNLQIRLPAVVIGGGLTGVDAATELQAYYIAQVEKILERHEILTAEQAANYFQTTLSLHDQEILNEFLTHARAIKREREEAKRENRLPNFLKLTHAWGGVTIVYRRSLQESPAYINNHEELLKALEEGIFYIEGLEPAVVELDQFGHSHHLICHKRVRSSDNEWVATNEEIRLAARTILVATGTQPNTAYEFEYKGTFNRLNLQYQHYEEIDGTLRVAHGVAHAKDPLFGPFTSYQKEDNRVSLIGDTHPVFHGSVVKAIASGLRTYPKIIASLQPKLAKPPVNDYQEFAAIMQQYFQARVTKITRKTPEIFELTIAAPLASQQFKPGQFYRLQNFENTALVKENTLLQMEPFIVVGADCDKTAGTLTFIIKESTVTAKLCATLKENDFVSLMGPTGVRTKIPHEQETLLIIGDQASFPFLRSVGRAAREAGNFVMFIGIFDHANDVYCREELESAADLILWLTKSAEIIPANPTRMNDKTFVYTDLNTAFHKLNSHEYILNDVDRVYLVGEVDLLRDFQSQRKELVKEFFFKNPKVFGSVYGSMQCMLKGVCAQCLQWQIDPETGLRTKAVFACSWQDQPLELIDLDHMQIRQFQNHFLEKFNALWVDYIFAKHALKTV